MQVHRLPANRVRSFVSGYWGFEERTVGALRRREGPGRDVVVILSFGNEWLIDDVSRRSFVGGLRTSAVRTEHAGWAAGVHIGLVPWAARALLEIPMHELAETTIALEHVLPPDLVDRLACAETWYERFTSLDGIFARRLAAAPPVSKEIVWAWQQLCGCHGNMRIGELTDELGWSRKRLVARFREHIGLPPKALARLLRFEHARALAGQLTWAEIAFACGYVDQPHLVSEFRAFTGRTPETFLQDAARARV